LNLSVWFVIARTTLKTIIHRNCLSVCLPDFQDLDSLLIQFVLVQRLRMSWSPRRRFLWALQNHRVYDYDTDLTCVQFDELTWFIGFYAVCNSVFCKAFDKSKGLQKPITEAAQGPPKPCYATGRHPGTLNAIKI